MKRIILATALFCAGCSSTRTPITPTTASGHPEVLVKNAGVSETKAKFVNVFVNEGYSIISSNDLGAELDKPSENLAIDMLMSCRYCARPRARINLSTIQIGKDVRVVATPYWLVNPGAPSERRVQIDDGEVVNYVRGKLAAVN
jgi:hypothetical protein